MPRMVPLDRNSTPELFSDPAFDGFGPSRFHPGDGPAGGHRVRGQQVCTLHKGVRKHAPKTPGVYAMLNANGRVIYVGKAKSLRCRLMSYFRTNSREYKAGRILRHTRAIVWEHVATEFAALLRELELIQRLRPRFNVLGQPGRQRYCYVVIGRPPATYAYVTRSLTGKEVAVYGPLVGMNHAQEAVRWLNDAFKLRDCAARHDIQFAEQKALFDTGKAAGCLRFELNTCLGPCGGGCTQRSYSAAVKAARAFLDGTNHTLLETIRIAMTDAAGRQQYERASALRDKLIDLEWLDRRLAMLRRSRDTAAFIYPLTAADGSEVWYLLDRGQVWGATRAPTCDKSRKQVGKFIHAMLTEPHLISAARRNVDSVLLVAAWFRKYAAEKERLKAAATANAECA